MSTRHHRFRELGPRPVQLAIVADTANYNLFTAAGSPVTAVQVIIYIGSGVVVSDSTGAGALGIPAFPAGSDVTIINYGTIVGKGGDGGVGGGDATDPGDAGTAGTDAIVANNDFTIDNTYGTIGGAGGGGGGGGGVGSGILKAGGGGGGGGRGQTPGSGGGNRGTNPGAGGFAGTATANGVGGYGSFNAFSQQGGGGGFGGGLGGPGTAGDTASGGAAGGVGGTAGLAIRLNGHAVTFTGGNNSSQVFGSVA